MSMVLHKPKVGETCNGCGICCKMHVCKFGATIMNLSGIQGDTVPGPCPALVLQDSQFKCGLILYPKKYLKSLESDEKLQGALMLLIGAGQGCDDFGEGATKEEEQRYDEMVQSKLNDPVFMQKIKEAIKLIFKIAV